MSYNYNKKEYIEKQELTKELLEQKVKKLAEDFTEKPERMVELLRFTSRFYRYSARNVLLIYSQNPNATFVDSFKKMTEKGYRIKKGQHGMKILVPVKTTLLNINNKWVKLSEATEAQRNSYKQGLTESKVVQRFKVGTVFDIAQTDCPIENYPKIYTMGYKSKQHNQLYTAVKAYCEKALSCDVVEEDFNSISLKGQYSISENKIYINDKLQDTEKISVLLHECGHAVLHNQKDKNINKTTAQIEFEADSISIMLQNNLDIEISESRQRHLAAHFTKLQEGKQENIPDINTILKNVSEQYESIINSFNEIVSESLEKLFSEIDNSPYVSPELEQEFEFEQTM